MPSLDALVPFLLLGALGAAHCAGMCGGFAAAVAGSCAGCARRALGRELAYLLGKASTYAVLGAAAARAGELAARGAPPALVPGARSALAWIAGAVLVGLGLRALGVRLPRPAQRAAPRLARALGGLYAGVRALPGFGSAFGTGLLTGLLPCGLSLAALVLAAASDVLAAALGMFLFGLATAPALLAVGLGWRRLALRRHPAVERLSGLLLLAFGALTVLRGGAPSAVVERALPECCAGVEAGDEAGDAE